MAQNPFKPTAGKNPPVLIGRDYVVDEFLEGIENGPGAPNRLMRVSGSRGMGKTVILNEIGDRARNLGWSVVDETGNDGFCARILEALRPEGCVSRVSAESSILGISFGAVEVERASLSLRRAIDEAARRNGRGLLITLDEVQDVSLDEMRALAAAIQHEIREDASIAFVFAGLPSMIGSVVNGKTLTFLRRAVPVELGTVSTLEVALSFKETMAASGMELSAARAGELAAATHGYPFMVQLVGYYAWQAARRSGAAVIGADHVERGIAVARERFDATVIEPALQRLPRAAVAYLLAMAEDGGGPSESSAVAARLGSTTKSASAARDRLIKDGIVEAPSWGKVAFAAPYMADYLGAHREELMA